MDRTYYVPCNRCPHELEIIERDGELFLHEETPLANFRKRVGKLAVRKNGGKRKRAKPLPKTPFPCKKCGKVCASKAGQSAHTRFCKGGE